MKSSRKPANGLNNDNSLRMGLRRNSNPHILPPPVTTKILVFTIIAGYDPGGYPGAGNKTMETGQVKPQNLFLRTFKKFF